MFTTRTVPASVIYPVTVNLHRVLDLPDNADWERLGTSLEELTGDWRADWDQVSSGTPGARVATHELGRAAHASGFEAIRYPSTYRPQRHNLVLFTELLASLPEVQLPEVASRAITWLGAPAS